MNKKESAPYPYQDSGQTFVGEGRGAPEAKIKPKPEKKKMLRE